MIYLLLSYLGQAVIIIACIIFLIWMLMPKERTLSGDEYDRRHKERKLSFLNRNKNPAK